MSLAAALRAQARTLDALADEAEARERQQPQGDPLLTDEEIAAELRVSRFEVCRMRRRGEFGVPVYISKRRPRVPRSAFEKYKEVAAQKRIA